MGHIADLRKQFKSRNTYDYTDGQTNRQTNNQTDRQTDRG